MHPAALPKGLGLVALILAGGAFATAQDSGWYLGGNVGQSRSKIDDARITANLLGAGFTTQTLDDHNKDTGFKVFGGYEFNRWFAFEGGYFNLGKFDYQASTVPAGTLDGSLKMRGAFVDGVLSLPFTEKFSAFGRFGVNYAQVKDSFQGTGQVFVTGPDESKTRANYKFGGGLQYAFTRCLALRAEVERYRLADPVGTKGDLDLASLGLVVRFGRSRPVQNVAYAEPVAVPAPPAPLVPDQVAATPVRTQTYCSILDLQFDIDKDNLQKEDLEKLAVVGTFMTKYPETTAVIEGHSDNVGTTAHNLHLSQSRAESVVTYLVDTLHLAPSRLTARGYGETHPLVSNATEEGKRRNRRIDAVITCATDLEGLPVAPARVTMAMVMEFGQNQDELKPEYHGELLKVATLLKANPKVTAVIEGHTANTQATPELALAISRRRAQNVVDYLVNILGIDRARLTAEGFGDEERFAYNSTAEGQHENRRVNIIFTYPKP